MEANERLRRNGIAELNDMQKAVGEAVLSRKGNVVALSPTGSGKTLAYLLPLVQMIDKASDVLQAVVILPGRELALQSADVLKRLTEGVRCCVCYGGRAAMEEHRTLRRVLPHIVFATPGRLDDHLNKRNIDPGGVRFVVIDEFDKCLEMGFSEEMRSVMLKMPGSAERILLSATDAESIPEFVDMSRAVRLDFLSRERKVSDRVRLYSLASRQKDKLPALIGLLRAIGDGSSMVFVNYRESAERVASCLKENGFGCGMYHGGLDQKSRETALYRFLNGSTNVLVCTDLASRGLDIPAVENIIHYHLPENEDAYIHRVGRTARWKAAGRSFFILGPAEQAPPYAVAEGVERYALPDMLPPVPKPKRVTLYIGKGRQNKISRADVLGFLCKKAGLKSAEIGRIDVLERYSYVAVDATVAARAVHLCAGEKIKGVKTVIEPVA